MRFYPCAWAAHDFRDRGPLENPRAQGDCRARLAEAEIERVEVAIARYQQPADIGIRGEHRAQLACIEQACLRVDCVGVQLFLAGGEVTHVARLQCHVEVAAPEIAVDRMIADPCLDDLVAAPADLAQHRGHSRTVVAEQPGLPAHAPDQLPAVAPRSAPADAVLFEQYHAVAALRQAQRAGHTGETAADDAHIGAHAAFERRMHASIVARCGVIRGAMFRGNRLVHGVAPVAEAHCSTRCSRYG